MAYWGRGNITSIGNRLENNNDNEELNVNDKKLDERMRYGYGLLQVHLYLPLSNTYVIFSIISALVIYLIVGIAILTVYKSPIIDPLEDTKKLVMNSYTIINFVLLTITLLVNYFSKDKVTLVKRLVAILAVTIIAMLVFCGIKLNLDSTYTSSKFEQIYREKYGVQNANNKSRVDIGLTGIGIKTEKQHYVDKCIEAYNIFSIRMYGIIIVNILLIILLTYQIFKVSNLQQKREQLNKDDAILYDEEENVKM